MVGRLPEHVANEVREAIRAAEMERASFQFSDGPCTLVLMKGGSEDFASVTDLVRAKTKLYRDSWIISPLKRILEWSAKAQDEKADEWDLLQRLRAPLPHPAVLEEAHQEIVKLRARVADLERFKRGVEGAIKEVG